jgi:hypothetical protein
MTESLGAIGLASIPRLVMRVCPLILRSGVFAAFEG